MATKKQAILRNGQTKGPKVETNRRKKMEFNFEVTISPRGSRNEKVVAKFVQDLTAFDVWEHFSAPHTHTATPSTHPMPASTTHYLTTKHAPSHCTRRKYISSFRTLYSTDVFNCMLRHVIPSSISDIEALGLGEPGPNRQKGGNSETPDRPNNELRLSILSYTSMWK